MEHQVYRARVHKFSSKPPGHDAARQRENQRRHRARVKGHIADLEAALSNTQNRLDEALRQIATLTAEVKRLQALPPTDESTLQTPAAAPQGAVLEPVTCTTLATENEDENDRVVEEDSPKCGLCPQTDDPAVPPGPSCTAPKQGFVAGTEPLHPASTQTATNPHVDIEPITGFEDPNSDCPLLPAPSAGESTIPCRDAYLIIKDRSSLEFDLCTANEWLKPGFRRAIVPGTGCRVQTHILFAFVDHMTPI
jgi:hypothetical protein